MYFHLRLQDEKSKSIAEPLSVTNIQEMLFKLDAQYLKEEFALKYALSKLEDSTNQTKLAFNKLSSDAGKLSFYEGNPSELDA